MSTHGGGIDRQVATWEGNRRERVRRTMRWTLRQRLEAMEDLAGIGRCFANL